MSWWILAVMAGQKKVVVYPTLGGGRGPRLKWLAIAGRFLVQSSTSLGRCREIFFVFRHKLSTKRIFNVTIILLITLTGTS